MKKRIGILGFRTVFFGWCVAVFGFCSLNHCLGDERDDPIVRGKYLIEREDYLGALAAFKEAEQSNPSALLVFNIAMCQKALYRYTAAIESFRRFLKIEDGKTGSEQNMRQIAERAIEDLKSLLGSLRIVGAPDGAEIMLDGSIVGEAPLPDALKLDPGEHTVEIDKTGYAALRRPVRIVSGQELEIAGDLSPEAARISIDCRGEKGEVRLDSKPLGRCPLTIEVKPGRHDLKVVAGTSPPYIESMDVAPGGDVVVSVHFQNPLGAGEVEREPELKGSAGSSEKARWLKATGWSALGVGAATAGLGAYFAVQWTKNENRVEEIAGQGSESFEEWSQAYADYSSAQRDATRNYSGMVVSFAVAGALTAAGACLLMVERFGRLETDASMIVLTPGGIGARF